MSGKNITGFRPGSKSWKLFMAKLYGIGAAIVIVGALFKIMHWPGAGPMLIVGLTTEAIIFFFSAFEPPHEEPDWSLVYPELAAVDDVYPEEDAYIDGPSQDVAISGGDRGLTQQLDEMLEEAKIGPELMESLGAGLRGLSDQASKLGDMADVSVASQEFANNIMDASKNAAELSESYIKASSALSDMSFSNEDGENYSQQMQKITKNLSELNTLYETQLQDTTDNLEAAGKMSEGIRDLLQNLSDSIDDTKRYKENIADLSDNLTNLNTVYRNMLGAMNFNNG
ncbi:MAG: gliding motility protein GldL [Flavobacteriales bacterium]|nr:gliding motility protein GldL [Flavobacteriales bacterium]